MIGRAQRLRNSSRDGNDGVAFGGGQSLVENGLQEWGIDDGHIAGDDHIPAGMGPGERGFDSAQRTRAGHSIGDYGNIRDTMYGGISNNYNRFCYGLYDRDRSAEQRISLPDEIGFIGSHARAAASGKHETRSGATRHAQMITLRKSAKICIASPKMLQKCFIIGLSMTAMASYAPAEGRKVVSVVRTDVRTGKLIRRTVVSPATQQTQDASATLAAPALYPPSIQSIVDESAERNQVEAPLIHSVIRAESGFNPLAVSNKGAQGLMQLIPATAKRFGVRDSFDSKENVEGGVKYLRYLIDLFHGDYTQAVAAYNAGEAAVTKYGGVPPYKETRNYVATVARNLEQERRAFAARPKPAASSDASVGSEELASDEANKFNPITASVGTDGRTYYRTP